MGFEMTDVIISGSFYREGKFEELSVAVEDGIIRKIGKDVHGAKNIRISGGIFPGATDIHVHFRDPGETHKEDFASGSLSAIYGGTTTVFDMPNNVIPVTDYDVFENKLSIVSGRSFCDFGLYSMYTGSNSSLISSKSSGIKSYLGESTNATAVGGEMKGFDEIEKLPVPKVFHAESFRCLKNHHTEGVKNLREHNLSRPLECEIDSLKDVKGFPLTRKIAAHITSEDSARTLGDSALKEVTPHHLLLNDMDQHGSWARVNPPLREREVQEKLLAAYLSGSMDIVSSDHAPHTEEDKEDFEFSKSGLIGVETRIPLMLALVKKGILSMERFYSTCIRNPAAAFGLRKGELKEGYYADFFAANLSDMSGVKERNLHSKTPFTPFNGFQSVFPNTVILRGEVVIENREAILEPMGRHVLDLRRVE